MPRSEFLPLGCAVVTVSDTRTEATDRSGALVASALEEAGHRVIHRGIVPDDLSRIRATFERHRDDPEVAVVVSTGGTGITRRDVTPEALAPLVTKPIPGFGELFRHLSFAEIGTATIQSRAEAAVCGRTLFFLLPGSTGACRLAMERILIPQLDARSAPCNFAELLPRV